MRRRKVNRENEEENIRQEQDGLNAGLEILNRHKKIVEEERNQRIGKRPNIDPEKIHTKKVEDQSFEEDEEKERPKSNFKRIFYSLLIIIIIFTAYFIYEYYSIIGLNPEKEVTVDENSKIDIVSTESDIYKLYDNELLVYSNQYLRMYNSSLEQTFEFEFSELFTPSIYIEGSYMAAVNKSSGRIYLFKGKNELFEKQIDGSIKNLFLDSNGNMAIEYSITGYKRIIGVYGSNGENKYNVNINGSGINKIILLDNASKLVISQADTTSLTYGTIIKTVEEKDKENIKEVAKFDNSLLSNMILSGKDIIMLLDNQIVKYNVDTGTLDNLIDFANLKLLFVRVSNDYFFTFEEANETTENATKSYTINAQRINLSKIFTINVQDVPKNIYTTGLLNFLLYNDKILVINKWGIIVKTINISNIPKDIVIFNNEKSVAIIYTNKINIVNL